MVLVGGGGLAQWAWATGDYARATAALAEGLDLYVRLGDGRSVADSLEGLARVALSRHNSRRAARLFAAADTIHESHRSRRMRWNWPTREEEHAAVRTQVGAEDFEAAWAEGRAMTLEQAITYALAETAQT